MEWIQKEFPINGRVFQCGYVVANSGSAPLDEAYEKVAADARARGDACFMRRRSGRKVPTGNVLNGIPLYRHELIPDELWQIKQCSVRDSVEIAIKHFDAPSLDCCLHGESSRGGIWRFLEERGLAGRISLTLVSDAGLTFEMLPAAPKLTRQEVERVIDFCLNEFKSTNDREEQAALVSDFVQMNVFVVGAM